MKKFLMLILAGTLLLTACVLSYQIFLDTDRQAVADSLQTKKKRKQPPKPTWIDNGSNVVVYLVPHQDDEVLTFSVPILNDIRGGKKVYLVLMSDGRGTFARTVLNGKFDQKNPHKKAKPFYCRLHKRYHDPQKEHYLHGWLTIEDVAEIRLREFYHAAEALGIPSNQVRLNMIEHFTYDTVRQVILQEVKNFPNAVFKSMSPIDSHKEHAMCGIVLNDLLREGKVKQAETHFASIFTDRFSHKKFPGYKMRLTHQEDAAKVRKALKAYMTWNPEHGEYAIGYHSVPSQFISMERRIYTKIIQEKRPTEQEPVKKQVATVKAE
ncbi:PIG-L deacetylase family protein [Lihuaxuella thermophila]|uniref:GlcNAc-PI de-N-acetylase n=1 Tax=Lihuaxuella thermophila TaxID=1173111 RepID=A0A1H8I0B8_9BACL|nr:PIG-L family deacetylase [Lihuaxuella thermophila]SEN61694.1 GlcNAc-PI de-N-acetylase [Lihuaxuella thermophila]